MARRPRGEPSRWHPDERRIDDVTIGVDERAQVNRSSLHARLTGLTGVDVSGKGDNVRGMLLAIGGASERSRSGINISEAARRLGVHRSTVARWVKGAAGEPGGSRPSADHIKQLRRRSRQATSTKAGRRAAAAAARAKYAGRSVEISVTGRQGIAPGGGPSYVRWTSTAQELSPEQFDRLMDAYETGGDKAFSDMLTRIWRGEEPGAYGYEADWGFESMERFEFR